MKASKMASKLPLNVCSLLSILLVALGLVVSEGGYVLQKQNTITVNAGNSTIAIDQIRLNSQTVTNEASEPETQDCWKRTEPTPPSGNEDNKSPATDDQSETGENYLAGPVTSPGSGDG